MSFSDNVIAAPPLPCLADAPSTFSRLMIDHVTYVPEHAGRRVAKFDQSDPGFAVGNITSRDM